MATPGLKIDNAPISDYSIALSHIQSMRLQCAAAMDTIAMRSIDSPATAPNPAIRVAMERIYEVLMQVGDDLEAVAMEKGESVGGYK